ncbi:hypothetical protein IV203_035215 [Nitzschia inconspicua]|uniref:Uncharacterized protein n=1 Tax=Nitzschia inconspicua TaxID=303405 RepID=A0A9K3PUQ3_9STRA|nr:hypothetical protein IV203_035215 [Nitzschia inconspicua]
MKRKAQDIICAAGGGAHVEDQYKKRHDPLLKLYYERPLYINHNADVAGCVANGALYEYAAVTGHPIFEFCRITVLAHWYPRAPAFLQPHFNATFLYQLDATVNEPNNLLISVLFTVSTYSHIMQSSGAHARQMDADFDDNSMANNDGLEFFPIISTLPKPRSARRKPNSSRPDRT